MKPIHNIIVKIKELFKWIKDGIHFTNLFLINKLKSVKPRRATRNNNASMKPKNYFLDSPIKNIRLVNLEFVGKIIDIDDTKVNSGIPLIKLNISQVELKASRVEPYSILPLSEKVWMRVGILIFL